VVTHTFNIGGVPFGIRTTSEAVGDWLAETFAEFRSEEDVEPHWGIVVGDGGQGSGKKEFHVLYRSTMALTKTFDIRSLGLTLLSEVESVTFPDRDDAIFLDCAVVTSNGVRGLMPAMLIPYFRSLGRRIDRSAVTFPAEHAVAIHPVSGEVIPVQRSVEIPTGALDALARAVPTAEGDRRVVDRAMRMDVVCSIGVAEEDVRPMSKGATLHRMVSHVLNFPKVKDGGLEGLIRLVERAQCYELRSGRPAEMLESLSISLSQS
jgi:hypothetical protein